MYLNYRVVKDMSPDFKLKGALGLFKVFQSLLLLVIVGSSGFALAEYKGQTYIYILFTLMSSGLLYCGLRRNALFFDTFMGVFLWLGFWLKLTIRVAFMGGEFGQAVGSFDGSGAAFDRTLLVTSCAFSGLILASLLREKFLFVYPSEMGEVIQQGLFEFYKKYRVIIIFGFVILIALVAVTNVYFGFYQRGSITRTFLPFGLNGVYKWLLLFGLASISALILRFEYARTNRVSYVVAIVALMECFASNVSLLSRGMILNGSALIYGAAKGAKLYPIKFNLRYILVTLILFFTLFIVSVLTVNYLRVSAFHQTETNIAERIEITKNQTSQLFIDRWVGIEGVMAVSSFDGLGWGLWREAVNEKYSENKLSFFDANIIISPYKYTDTAKHHFISLPGIVAFFFYPSSYAFLFLCMVAIGIIGALIEIFVYKVGGENLFLCSLLAQVVAFRFASFGYVPAQSYLLFGALILNVLIIYLADKILTLSRFQKLLRLQ